LNHVADEVLGGQFLQSPEQGYFIVVLGTEDLLALPFSLYIIASSYKIVLLVVDKVNNRIH
jgi:hypothetical protein